MLDLLKSFWDRAVSEGGVVSGAPSLFLGAVLFLATIISLGIWQLMDWRYNGVIAGRDAIISARDAQIILLSAQTKELSEQLSKAKSNLPSANLGPDDITQNDKIVGRIEGAVPAVGNGRYSFRSISTGDDFNPNFAFIYRGIRMKIDNSPLSTAIRGPQGTFKKFLNAECVIVE